MPYSRESYSEFPSGQDLTFTIWAVQVEQSLRDTYQTTMNKMYIFGRNDQKRFVNKLYDQWERGISAEDAAYALANPLDTKDYTYTPSPSITVGQARAAARAYDYNKDVQFGFCPTCKQPFSSFYEAQQGHNH